MTNRSCGSRLFQHDGKYLLMAQWNCANLIDIKSPSSARLAAPQDYEPLFNNNRRVGKRGRLRHGLVCVIVCVERYNRFSAVPLLVPDRDDHIHAADLGNRCRRAGTQIGTIDALLAQLCVRHDLVMLSTDNDFRHVAGQCPLKLWRG